MGYSKLSAFYLLFTVLLTLSNSNLAVRKLTSLYQPPSMALTYHNGALLEGDLPVSIIWYGKFSPSQKSIVVDFLLSLDSQIEITDVNSPSVSHWWNIVRTYSKKAGKKETRVVLSNQVSDEDCSAGKLLKKSDVTELVHRVNSKPGGLTLVLTAQDIAVEGFCMSNCGFHESQSDHKSVYVWVGNSVTQCPGQCAWPFHQPIYGPQTEPLGAPNGDVGVDGMIVNIASLLAGAITNPFGNGYYLGSAEAPLEAASACPGVYGKGAYPGYTGEVLVDSSSGASYNSVGVNGRKYLLPGLFDPTSSQCLTTVGPIA